MMISWHTWSVFSANSWQQNLQPDTQKLAPKLACWPTHTFMYVEALTKMEQWILFWWPSILCIHVKLQLYLRWLCFHVLLLACAVIEKCDNITKLTDKVCSTSSAVVGIELNNFCMRCKTTIIYLELYFYKKMKSWYNYLLKQKLNKWG